MKRRSARKSARRRAILRTLVDHGAPLTASQITDALDCWPGTIYAELVWLEREGLVESDWADEPRPRRRLYRVTGIGRYAVGVQQMVGEQ